MKRFNCFEYMSGAALLLFALSSFAAPITEITLPGTLVFPESITSTADGTLIVGSLGHGNVLRIAPGSATAGRMDQAWNRRAERRARGLRG